MIPPCSETQCKTPIINPPPLVSHHVQQSSQSLTVIDQSLLQQLDTDSRQFHASQGRARLSLPPRPSAGDFVSARSLHGLEDDADLPDYHQSQLPLQRSNSPFEQEAPSSPSNALRLRRDGKTSASNHTTAGPYHHANSATERVPIVRNIPLVSTLQLPDRMRAIFPFPYFNAIQSKSFKSVFDSNDNFVLSSPTGSGKTVIFELAICRTMKHEQAASFKIVYMAPTKALCSERLRDWHSKFSACSLDVQEVTGDSDAHSLRAVQNADIIITTPEKWDSMTRKWRDHEKLIKLVHLLLIDEIHILGKDRGATLEAVVSRMKSLGSQIRFVALSATIPNAADIARWLGKSQAHPSTPATLEEFGAEFRPVPLKIQVLGYESSGNDFQFDSLLTKRHVLFHVRIRRWLTHTGCPML